MIFFRKLLLSLAGTAVLASVSRADLDTNANGASDIWEREFNNGELFTALDMTADPDGDGWSNEKEAVAGTDPFNSKPPLGMLQTEITQHPTVTGTFTLRWTPITGKLSFLYVSPDLETWTLFDTFPSTGDEIEIAMDVSHPDGSSPDKLFWRVMVSDTDSAVGNGLTDYETETLGMAPGFTDTNANSIPDLFETANAGAFAVFPPVLASKMPRLQAQTKPLFLWNDTGTAVNYTVTVNGADVLIYSHLDSLAGGVTYAWEEISATGTKLASISNADDASEAAPFSGFTFPFYGQSYSQVFVNSNGLLSFGAATTSYSNYPLPSTSAPPGIIAVLWDDLDTRDTNNSGEVFYKQESDRFIIQYQDVTRRSSTDTLTFQAVLFADGRIQLRYKTINGTTNSATVGVQNQTRDDGLGILYNASYLVSGLALEIVPVSEFLEISPVTGSVAAHSNLTLDAVFNTFRLVPGVYYAQVDVTHDAAAPSPIRIPARLEVENVPGTVALTSPAEGFSILEGKSVNFGATATDPEGVARVEFYYGIVKFAEDLTSSYSLSRTDIPAGTHYITARMVDVFGQIVDSSQRTLTVIADTDRDGIPNYWEIANGLDPNLQGDATLDADSDGYTNFEEYTLGKDPNLAEDSDGDGIPDGIERKLVIPTGGSSYDPFDLSKLDTDNNGINDGNEDYDRDGLTTLQEIAAGTDSNKTDTDRDGVNDGKEILIGTNPLIPDAFYDAQGVPRDWDNDGLSDVFEVEIGTDPFNDDTNNNGMKDGLEFDLGGTPGLPGLPPAAGGGGSGGGTPPPADPPPTPPTPLAPGSYKILVEEKSVNFTKYGFETFSEQNPPKRYLSRSSSQTFRGGCPESGPVDVTGSASASIDPLTGEETSDGDTFVSTGGDAQSPVRKAGSNSLGGYNDPPNNEGDCTGTVNYFSNLSSENTTEMMISNGKSKLESFEGGEALQAGTPFAYRNVHKNEKSFEYRKVQFKFKWNDDVTTEQKYPVKYLVNFSPEDDPDTQVDESDNKEIIKTVEWDGDGSESSIFIVDPDVEKSDEDGDYSISTVELMMDLDNDGSIGLTDGKLSSDAFASGATTEAIDLGTEFLFLNDKISNGIWDGEDPDTTRPQADKDDDDAQEIKINPGITEGEVWLEHPAISGLKFYKTRECKAADAIGLTANSKFNVSSSNPFPEQLFIRVEDGLTFVADNPQIEGDLVLKVKAKADTQATELSKLKLTIVKELRATKYFFAAQDYILENNSSLFLDNKTYANGVVVITVMREEATILRSLDSYHHNPKLYGIDEVTARYPNGTVVINGNMTFDRVDIGNGLELTRKCHGRLISGSALNSATSSDNPDENSPPPNMFGIPSPLRGSVLAGPDGKYIAMVDDGDFVFAKGRVPFTPLPKEALGGLSTNYAIQNPDQMMGIVPVTNNKEMLFTITNLLTTSGVTTTVAADVKKSGVEALPGGNPGELKLFKFDGGSSLSLSYAKPDGTLTTPIKGSKHTGRLFNDYCIHTYLMLKSTKPR